MQKNTTRRKVLKGAGAVAAYAGLGLGMPNVVRANDKVVRYLGTATTMGSEIDKKLFEDTGIKVQYIPVTTDEVTKRVLTQPNSFDIVDTEYFSLPKLVPSGNILGMDSSVSKILITSALLTLLARSAVRRLVTKARTEKSLLLEG